MILDCYWRYLVYRRGASRSFEGISARNLDEVFIFDDGRAQVTCGQLITVGMLERVLSGYQPYLRHILTPQDTDEIESALREAKNAQEMRIVVADYRSGQ